MNATLTIAFQSFWHPGSGLGGGYQLDAVALRDAHGLPTLAGRSIKGLLRDAVRRAESFGWLPQLATGCWEDRLFGSLSQGDGPTSPGGLRVGNAQLPAALRAPPPAHLAALRRTLFQTAMNADGVAAKATLRGIEAYVPLTLKAPLHWLAEAGTMPDGTWEALARSLPLADGAGAHRSRGLGRCCMSLEVCR